MKEGVEAANETGLQIKPVITSARVRGGECEFVRHGLESALQGELGIIPATQGVVFGHCGKAVYAALYWRRLVI